METTETTDNIELAIVKGATSGVLSFTPQGRIAIAEDTTYEQWREVLRLLKWNHKYLEVGLSDVISWGKLKFGVEQVNQELEQLEFELTMVKAAVAISDIPDDIRYPELEGSHYVELAKADLNKKDILKWAKIAAEQHLTPTQLRLSIKEGEVVDQAATKALAHGVITIHGIRQQFDVWINRVGGLEGITAMERDYQDEIMGELESMLALGSELKHYLAQAETADV